METIDIIEKAYSKMLNTKVIIRQLLECMPKIPSLKSIKTELYKWDGHKTILIYSNELKGRDVELLKKEGIQQLLIDLINNNINDNME